MNTDKTWTPDLEVAVHEGELIVRFDPLPPAEVDWEDGGIVLHDSEEVHCFHVCLPEALDHGAFKAQPADGSLELIVQLPA